MGGVFAADPVAFKFLIVRSLDRRSFKGIGFPAEDLVRLAAFVTSLRPLVRPAFVGLGRFRGLGIEEVRLAVAVGIDAEVDGGDRRVAGFGRAERFDVARAADS